MLTEKFEVPEGFQVVNDQIGPALAMLQAMKKPFIKGITKALTKKTITLYHGGKDVFNPNVILLNNKKDKVLVNISDITNNFENAVSKGSLPVGILYTYLLQAWAVLQWDKHVSQDRAVVKQAVEVYSDMMINAYTMNGIGHFRNEDERRKMKFLNICFILFNSKTIVSDVVSYAARVAEFDEDEAELMSTKYKKYFKACDFDIWLDAVMKEEFQFLTKIKSFKEVVVFIYRKFGPTAVRMIDDLRYYACIATDFVIGGVPLVYKPYTAWIPIMPKNNFKDILTPLHENTKE